MPVINPLSSVLRPDDGVVIVDHGSRVAESNQALLAIAKSFQSTLNHPIVEPAHMELAAPSISDAVASCVQQGAVRIVVVPFFLLPGRHWQQDIPQLTTQACRPWNVPSIVTAPLGGGQDVVRVLIGRMEHCLQSWEAGQGTCESCQSNSPCWQRAAEA